ncbi:phosphatase PAP2 family protein [Aspergillus clavatus NRRL 1]|uniref:PAP2 domain protein n=1 Tax=Aspergillus clavatus (strain ATCC 1007 / CBS 513.65 / DSM 816 / NCTC 3887 / NRRL 1 / QM 1276 / 107) TaxID=344612 RepID=A1CQE0_ASPCL|nr:PAP2 domain protein [Aspergillus clavatus NRRL 1]EAW07861.1 PAP2 domain protein [Aspergillus clavatus NRRL 1]
MDLTMRDALSRVPKRLVLSYILDWIFIVIIALIGFGFSRVIPNHHPFSLTELSISYPFAELETVRTSVMVVVSLIAPAIIIAILTLLLIPMSPKEKRVSRLALWGYKLWEWNAGWMGLALACAGVWMATEGLKDLFGRPRPDMIARCDPDLSKIAAYAVGGLGEKLAGAPTVVTWEICRNKSDVLKNDGFSSFPSGHSSFSFAGLTYLSLWLCSKFSISFPYLGHSILGQEPIGRKDGSIRKHGAAPPVYMVIIAFVPIAVASFIAASRWFDNRHHAFDILFGSIMGILFAYGGFRLYHLPITRGAGWSWGTRSCTNAFFRGVQFPDSPMASAPIDMHDAQKTTREDNNVERAPEYLIIGANNHDSKIFPG